MSAAAWRSLVRGQNTLQAFIRESNRGNTVYFAAPIEEAEQRLAQP